MTKYAKVTEHRAVDGQDRVRIAFFQKVGGRPEMETYAEWVVVADKKVATVQAAVDSFVARYAPVARDEDAPALGLTRNFKTDIPRQ